MINPAEKALIPEQNHVFQQVKYLVEEIYKLGTLNRLYQIFGGYVNWSYGAEITEPDGNPIDYYIRKYRSTTADEDILVEHRLITYAIERGFDLAAAVIPTPDGKTYVKLTENIDGKEQVFPWAISQYLYGDDPYDWVNNNLKNDEYGSMADVLAKFHGYTCGFNAGEKLEPPRYEFLEAKKDYFIHCPDGLNMNEKDIYLRYYRASLPEWLEACDVARKGIEESGMLNNTPKTINHSDYHVSNVKWKQGKCVAVFDFDWSREDYRLSDIGYSIIISIASWNLENDGVIDMDSVSAYLKSYAATTAKLNLMPAFSDAEKEAFPYYVLAGAVYLFNWSTDYFNNWKNLNEFEYGYYLEHLVHTLRFVRSHMQDFYDVIKSL